MKKSLNSVLQHFFEISIMVFLCLVVLFCINVLTEFFFSQQAYRFDIVDYVIIFITSFSSFATHLYLNKIKPLEVPHHLKMMYKKKFLQHSFFNHSLHILLISSIVFNFLFLGSALTLSDNSFTTVTNQNTDVSWNYSQGVLQGNFTAQANYLSTTKINIGHIPTNLNDQILRFNLYTADKRTLHSFDRKLANIEENNLLPIGYPIINDSQGKEFVFEISLDNSQEIRSIINTDKEVHTKYSFSHFSGLKKLALIPYLTALTLLFNRHLLLLAVLFLLLIAVEIIITSRLSSELNRSEQIVILLLFQLLKISIGYYYLVHHLIDNLLFQRIASIYLLLTSSTSILLMTKISFQSNKKVIVLKHTNILVAIAIIAFILMRIPFLSADLHSQLHADKTASYLPNLFSIIEKKDFFTNYNNAFSSLFTISDETIRPVYGEFPAFSWGLLPFFQILSGYAQPNYLLHISLTFYGVAFLLLSHRAFSRHIGKLGSAIFVTFIATNPIFHLLTFITVMDLPALMSLIIMLLFWKKDLQKTALWAGITILMKISFIPIVSPFLLISWYKSEEKGLIALTQTMILTLLPTVLFQILVNETANESFMYGIPKIVLFFFTLYFAPAIVRKLGNLLEQQTKNIKVILFIIATTGSVFLFLTKAKSFLQQFLPEISQFFDLDIYFQIFQEVLAFVNPVFATIAIYLLFYFKELPSKTRNFVIVFVSACLLYLTTGLKVIYFHAYYKHIFILLILLASTLSISQILKNIKKRNVRFLLIIVLLTTTATNYSIMNNYLDRDSVRLDDVVSYLSNNLPKSSKVLRADSLSKNVVLYNPSIQIINFTALSDAGLRQVQTDIAKSSLIDSLNNYNVKYVLVDKPEELRGFYPWLSSDLSQVARSDIITGDDQFTQNQNLDEIIFNQTLELEAEFTHYQLYRVKQ